MRKLAPASERLVERGKRVLALEAAAVRQLADNLDVAFARAVEILAAAKGRVAERLVSSATKSESRQTVLCAYLSAALLVGLGANAAFGWWWADPVTALLIAAVAVNEGREAWRGESCCTAPVGADGCCD